MAVESGFEQDMGCSLRAILTPKYHPSLCRTIGGGFEVSGAFRGSAEIFQGFGGNLRGSADTQNLLTLSSSSQYSSIDATSERDFAKKNEAFAFLLGLVDSLVGGGTTGRSSRRLSVGGGSN